jgi:methylglutaconyl-CoA hydratase
MTQSLLIDTDARGVTTLRLSRPERRNAFDAQVIAEMSEHLQTFEADPQTRLVVLTGTGEAFSSGADLAWMRAMAERDARANLDDARELAHLMEVLDGLAKPTIACVNGVAFGGGAGLVACCDIAIASNAARFGFVEVHLGLVAAVIAPYVVSAIGPRQARRFLLSGQPISADQAERIGLVHRVVSPDSLDDVLKQQVDLLLMAGPEALAETKRLIGRIAGQRDDIREYTAELLARVRASPEAREGTAAFVEKREPSWRK